MVCGKELEKQIVATRQRFIDNMDNRAERIRNWQTDDEDCFMSQRVEEQGISECNMQLEILKGDGLMDYEALFDAEGKEVRYRWIGTKYGTRIVANGVFANSMNALLKKTGLIQKTIRVPVWTKFSAGSGGGLCAVYSGTYVYTRWHTNMVTGEYIGYPD